MDSENKLGERGSINKHILKHNTTVITELIELKQSQAIWEEIISLRS